MFYYNVYVSTSERLEINDQHKQSHVTRFLHLFDWRYNEPSISKKDYRTCKREHIICSNLLLEKGITGYLSMKNGN